MATDRSSKLSEALLDVRRSYRVIGAYQKRILGLMDYVRRSLPGALFHDWEPEFWDKPARKVLPSDRKWTLDGLPFFAFSVKLLIPSKAMDSEQFECAIQILHNADTGVDDVDFEKESDLSELENPRETESVLYFYGWKSHSPFTLEEWRDFYREVEEWPSDDDVLTEILPGKCWALRKSYKIDHLVDRADVDKALAEFSAELQKQGFKLPS